MFTDFIDFHSTRSLGGSISYFCLCAFGIQPGLLGPLHDAYMFDAHADDAFMMQPFHDGKNNVILGVV